MSHFNSTNVQHKNPRDVIVRRAYSASGKIYFRMADGSLIKPETAIKRGLIDRDAYEKAVKDEQEQFT